MTITRQQVRRTDTNYAQINAKLREIQARFDHENTALSTVDLASVERICREFSRKGDPDDQSSDKAMTFWSGFETFIFTKVTDRAERTIANYRTLQTILHELEGGYGYLSQPTTPLASTLVRSRPSSNGTKLSAFKTSTSRNNHALTASEICFCSLATPAHGSVMCKS